MSVGVPTAAPERRMVDFEQDDEGAWVARLECGHSQHVRHEPPFQERPWVLREEGRRNKIGATLPCRNCLMPRLPDGVSLYKTTPIFDATSIPKGLTSSHRTKAGTWGRIVVHEGWLLYTIEEPEELCFTLSPALPGIVAPSVPHRVAARGAVRFAVEFHR